MIAISGLLVLVAIGLLVTGLVLPNLWFVYASIVASLASAVCLVVDMFIDRGQAPTPRTASAKGARSKASGGPTGGSAKRKTTGNRPSGRRSAKTGAGGRGGRSATMTKEPAADEATVVVVPGRLRYHLASCRQVTGKDTEERAVAEARAEGYVACTSCRPDAVLAARAEQDAAASGSNDSADAADSADSETVVVVTGQRRYHRAACQVVEDARDDDTETRELALTEAAAEDLTPCRVCAAPEPEADTGPDTNTETDADAESDDDADTSEADADTSATATKD